MKRIIIAIDGHSSTGKSTLARQLAKALGYIYVDSGAMYRAVTLYAMKQGIVSKDGLITETLIEHLPNIHLHFEPNAVTERADMCLNGVNVEQEIRSMDVSEFVSQVSAVPEVRRKLVSEQHKIGAARGVVMDGRDIGTVVFPDAELKFFMTASPEIRAKRRFQELESKGMSAEFDAVLQNVIERDHQDSTRKDSPLVQASDAIVIDNSELSMQAQFDLAMSYVNRLLSQ